jgi:hypothetical protein
MVRTRTRFKPSRRLGVEKEGGGKQIAYLRLDNSAVQRGKGDYGVEGAELVDGLATGSAGLAGFAVEVGYGDGAYMDRGAMEAHGRGYSGLFGAGGETVGGIFDVAANHDGAIGEQKSGADAEFAIGRIGVMGNCIGASLQVFYL